MGDTTTLEAGSNATVENVGTENAARFNFGIPRGANGADGKDGKDGADGAAATIEVGTVTTLPEGSNATVTNAGTTSAAKFNFGIPRGATGQTGETGQPGPAGADGYSPQVTLTQTTSTVATLSITSKNAQGQEVTQTVSFGGTWEDADEESY